MAGVQSCDLEHLHFDGFLEMPKLDYVNSRDISAWIPTLSQILSRLLQHRFNSLVTVQVHLIVRLFKSQRVIVQFICQRDPNSGILPLPPSLPFSLLFCSCSGFPQQTLGLIDS
jgi:hypothetical protein